MKKNFMMFFTLLSLSFLSAQPTLNVFNITGKGVSEKTLNNINYTLYAFLKENKNYKVIDCRTYTSTESDNIPQADFYFYGNLLPINDKLKLDLILKTVQTGTIRLLTNTYQSENQILLESKSLLEKLLDQTYEIKNVETTLKTTDANFSTGLAGTWSGEDDIKSIKLLQNGRGVVIFKSGLSISVDFTEKNNSVTIIQKSTITERQFPNLSRELASEAVKNAIPIKWELKLNEKQLFGTRTESIATSNDNKNVSIQTQTQEVKWTKID